MLSDEFLSSLLYTTNAGLYYMGAAEIAELLKTKKGVHGAHILDGELLKEAFDEEKQVTESSFGMPLVNRALEECLKKHVFVCLFCDYGFELPTDHVMIMEDGNGNIVGFDIPPGQCDQYTDRADITYLSDDFVMLPEAACDEIRIVMLPQKVKCIDEKNGVKDPVLFYPATTTDGILKKRFGIDPASSDLASVIMAFDLH